ncbi:hypothetical protein D3C71_159230 [compost metagenome]
MKRNLLWKVLAVNLSLSIPAMAQNPGGVPVTAWYRADVVSSLFSDAGITNAGNNTTIQQWNEYQGTGFNLLQSTAGSRPVFSASTTLANFNPTVTFDGSNDWMQFSAGTGVNIIDRVNGSLYAAGYVNVLKRNGFLGFHSSMDYPGLHLFSNTNQVLFFTGGPGYQGLSPNALKANMYFNAGSGWQNGGGTNVNYAAATVSMNGDRADYLGSQLNNANQSTGARNLRIGADDNYGSFSGQLNEILVFEDRLTAAQMDQLETYLAIKYGTTYASGTKDYKNAAGATVWAAASHTAYKNNIAGIARDDNGALHQKQSWSTNTGTQVLIGTNGLANTNAANASGLSNGQYLIWGDNGLAKVPTVSFTGSGLSHRFAAVWQVQNTGAVGTVRVAWPQGLTNLSLIQSTDATFATGNTITGMTANTTTINGVVYNYAEVTLANGQYFTFGAKLAGPGGVTTGLLMWHKADDGTAAAGQKNIWKDISGNGRDVIQTNNAAYQPLLVTSASYNANSKDYNFNFNPFYYFDGTNDFFYRLNDSYFPTANSAGSVYGVMLNSTSGGWRTAYGWGDDDPNLVRGDNAYYLTRDNGTVLVTNSTVTLNTKPSHIGGMSWRGSTNGMYMNIDGQSFSTTSYNVGSINSAGNFAIGSEGYNLTANGYEQYQGAMSEVFAYSTDHQNSGGDEKQRINSYLALKYGITLKNDAGTNTTNYLSSTSAVVWDTTINNGYNNSIAGLVNDENSALNQKQSRSNVSGQQVLIGTTGLANTNGSNNTALTNGQYLIWGDNGLTKALSAPLTGVAGLNLRFAAIWKVQNTNAVGAVRIAWPAGIVNITLIQSTDAVFDATDTRTDMSTNTQTINGVAYNYADVTLANGQYFTFGGYIAGPGGVGTDLSLWYKADNGVTTDANKMVTEWATTTTNAVNLTPNGTAVLPYNDQTTYTSTWNFNPTVSFDGTNNYLRNNTTAYLNTAGSVHYIVVARNPQRNTVTRCLVAVAGNDDAFFYSGVGGNTAFPAIGNNFNITAAAIASPNNFGIYSAVLPKTGSPVNQRGFYNGLMKVYASPYPYTGGNYSLPTTGAYIGADGTSGDNFSGDIAEVVLYHNPTGGDMTNADMSRIHSYLALKYGITLDQTSAQNYVNSSSAVVWDATTANVGYNYSIAGIGRDDVGSLNQKQSKSANAGQQVLVSTTGLESTNAANTGLLTNGQFLIWGDNNLAKAPTVSIAGISGINYRFGSIWKVQNTGAVGTVRVAWPKGYANLKLIQSTDETITSSDVITDMTNSQVVNGVDYNYADVTLANGQYFTFAAFIQAPGGVTNNLSYWYRADKFAEANAVGSSVTSWTDFTAGTVSAQLGDNAQPVSAQGSSTYFNYNPGIKFTTASQSLGNLNVQTVTSLNYDVFTLTKEGVSPGGNGRIFSSLVNNADQSGSINYWDGIGIMADQRIERMNTAYSNRYLANPGSIVYSTNSPSIMYNKFSDLDVSKGLNGAANGTAGTNTARGQFNGGHAFGSTQFSSNGSDNAGFTGDLGEVIIYGNGNISAAERNKVESYLAIKYGITLNNSNNYTTSQNVVVWNAATNATYYNNVAGVGYDYISALLQKQSRSQHTNTNGQVIMGLGEIDSTNDLNPATLADGQFLLWGDNGNTQAMTNTASTYTAFNYSGGTNNARRMNRIWKVQNTNVANDMQIRFPVASVGTTTLPLGDACGSYAILFASDSTFTSNLTVVPLTVNGTDYDVTHAFPNGTSFFTFAKLTPLANGVVYLPSVTETTDQYNNNCGVGEWVMFNQTGNATQKLLGMAGYTTTELNNFDVVITPEGIGYDDGTRTTNLMPRITTVLNGNTGAISTGKVRVYYSQTELNATIVPGAVTNSWFKYEGNADSVLTDVYNDGVFLAGKAIAITPDATGVENGVNYVEFHNINSFSSFVYLSSTENVQTVLPVQLTTFTATKAQGSVVLDWTTASEQHNKGFAVEHSTDARNWNTIGFVNSLAASGTSDAALNYSYTHKDPVNGNNFYRLKQTDFDGNYVYSPVRMVGFAQTESTIRILPNPVRSELWIQGLNGSNKIVITNATGQVMVTIKTENVSSHMVNMGHYAPGLYIISVVKENGMRSSYKVIKE